MDENIYVQYGCGMSAPAGWRNFDASPTLRFERIPILGRLYTKNSNRFPSNIEFGDITRKLPVSPSACKGVYCSHVLEHLSLNDFRIALRNTFDLLEPGGIFRFVLPDLELMVRQYVDNTSSDAAIVFIKDTLLGQEKRERGIRSIFASWAGNSQHLWLWDYKSIKQELEKAGFVDVRRAYFGDSSDPYFSNAEDQGRWNNALGIECFKPIPNSKDAK